MKARAQRGTLPEIARDLLAGGRAEVVLGYTRGTQPLMAAPAFVRSPDGAKDLIFDRTCEQNLTNYLRDFKGRKVAIVVKGCDERSLVGLIQEKQVSRDNLVVIGAPCTGVVDRRLATARMGGRSIADARLEGDAVVLVMPDGEETPVPLGEVTYEGCRTCPVRNPRFADYVVSEPVAQPAAPARSARVAEMDAMSGDERWETFRREMDKCILCFACRNLCPACYCAECFADSSQPKWMSKTDDPADVMFYHMTRLLHLAGRCTGCGACVRGCPMNVDLQVYNDKLRETARQQFDFEAGMDPETEPPLSSYRADDMNDFIM